MEPEQATKQLEQFARAQGWSWFGVAAAKPLEQELERLREWLAEGRHGTMEWIARDPERRADPRLVVDGCRSVVVLGLNYLREDGSPTEAAPGHGIVSKYARTRDYHRVLEGLGRRLARHLTNELVPYSAARFLVDYGPVMERPWGALAGLGFIGKHTLLIHPLEGSFHFLGVLLTNADLAPTAPVADPMTGCGACRRCIDACPTGAITEPHRLDARRCLSYLTIEHDGPVDESLWPRFEGRLFGCDICQDVCPYNVSRARPVTDSPLGEVLVPGVWKLAEMLRITRADLAQIPAATPLRRAGADRLVRNAAIVASEQGSAEDLVALEAIIRDPDRPEWLSDVAARCAARLRRRLRGEG